MSSPCACNARPPTACVTTCWQRLPTQKSGRFSRFPEGAAVWIASSTGKRAVDDHAGARACRSESTLPVSYTHLDVYKRQAFSQCARPTPYSGRRSKGLRSNGVARTQFHAWAKWAVERLRVVQRLRCIPARIHEAPSKAASRGCSFGLTGHPNHDLKRSS